MRYRADNGLASDNPIDIVVDNYVVVVRGVRIPWRQYAFEALFQVHRIELFHNIHLAPMELDPLAQGYLNGERTPLIRVIERMRFLSHKNTFYKYVNHMAYSEYTQTASSLLVIFKERRRQNSALDLHLRACARYQMDAPHIRGRDSLLSMYKDLEGNPIQEYWKRVALCRSMHSDECGWKMQAELK